MSCYMFCLHCTVVCVTANPSISSLSNAYQLATHTVKVRRTGALYDAMALWDLTGCHETLTELTGALYDAIAHWDLTGCHETLTELTDALYDLMALWDLTGCHETLTELTGACMTLWHSGTSQVVMKHL